MNSGKNKSLQGLGNQDIRANVRVSGRICGLVKTQGENPGSCPLYTSTTPRVLAQLQASLCRMFEECSHGYLLP